MKFETRLLPKDEALAFIDNMRWFAGFGRITAKPAGNGMYSVRASCAAWSKWVGKR